MKECVKRLWNTLKTTFLNVKLQRLWQSHHLQSITSSKDSEKLEKSLCVRDKAVSEWKSVLWSDESKSDILVVNHGRRVLRAKEEGHLPACYQCSVQKPASLMVWGCISVYGMGSLHVLEGTMNAEMYTGFRATYAPLQRTCSSAGQCKTHTAAITTA